MRRDSNHLQDSLFDNDETFGFIKPKPSHTKYLNNMPSITSQLICQQSSKPGFYSLYSPLIACHSSELYGFPETVLAISYGRLELLCSNSSLRSYGFRITKNQTSWEFFSSSLDTIQNWFENLKKVCVLTNLCDEYKTVKILGSGSFAQVYLMESKTTGNRFAVKSFSKEELFTSTRGHSKIAMMNEIDIMRHLDHQNVIKLYEVYETDHSIYLVMEYIPNKSLRDVLKTKSLKKDVLDRKIMKMIYSLLSALAYLASKGIMHRDLKPANILVDNEGDTLKIIDFGLATPIYVSKFIFRKCGTPGYIAPEIFKYTPSRSSTFYDDRCDVFSAGCIFYSMLFGHKLFDGCDGSDTLSQNKSFSAESRQIKMIKREIKNNFSPMNKEALNLLLLLIDPNPKRRITAEHALNHPYFTPLSADMYSLMLGRQSSKAKTTVNQYLSKVILCINFNRNGNFLLKDRSINDDHIFTTLKDESFDQSSVLSKNGIKFTEKDSLYLDSQRSEQYERSDSLSSYTTEGARSPGKRSCEGLTPIDSFSSVNDFNVEIKSPRLSIGNNQSILKKAILNRVKINSAEVENGEEKRYESAKNHKIAYGGFLSFRTNPPCQSESLQEGNNSDTDDIGDEDAQVSVNFDKIKSLSKEKHPSKMMQRKKKSFTV